jgi:hypothetical protein
MIQQLLIPSVPAIFCQLLHRAATNNRRTSHSVLTCLMVRRSSCHIHVTYFSQICHRKHGRRTSSQSCAKLTHFGGAIMLQRMQHNLHSRTGHSFEGRKMCNVRIPRSEIALVESRFETEFETNQVQCDHAHDNSYQKDLIKYLYAACLSPET